MENEKQLLKQIAHNVVEIKEKLTHLEEAMKEANLVHKIKPEYIKKLKKLDEEGTISEKEFEDKFGVLRFSF